MALLNTDIAYGTLAPRTSSSEFISFTGITQNVDGTATLTGVTRGLAKKDPFTTSATFKLPHSGQSVFIISDAPQLFNKYSVLQNAETITGLKTFPGGGNANAPVSGTVYAAPTNDLEYASKKYVDGVAIAGSPDATLTVKGLVEIGTTAEINAGTSLGGTGASLAVRPDQLAASIYGLQLPSSVQKASMDNGGLSPTGTVIAYAGASAPTGWLLCDASAVSRTTYAALFAIVSTTYGVGNGTTTFNVPDMRGRIPVGVGTGTGGGASGTGLPSGGSALTVVSRASWKGEETHVLIVGELAAHTHTVPFTSGGGLSTTHIQANNGTPTVGNETSGSTGSDTAHNNIQPVLGVNFLIKT